MVKGEAFLRTKNNQPIRRIVFPMQITLDSVGKTLLFVSVVVSIVTAVVVTVESIDDIGSSLSSIRGRCGLCSCTREASVGRLFSVC